MDLQQQIFVFKVCLKHQKSIFRTMELKGGTSLYDFAQFITSAFDFNFNHAFGFFNNIKRPFDSDEAYSLFADEGKHIEPKEQSVKRSHVYKVFEPSKKMIFLYDYGDSWEFLVECQKVNEPVIYPRITKKKGEAPSQYPEPYDDDEDEDF